MKVNQNSKGFTLTEMIVVMAIILVLSLLVYPVIMKGIEKGQQAQCIGHLKQLGIAIQMYAIDWDGNLPYAKRHTHASNPESIVSCLSSYISNDGVYICKSTEASFKNQHKLSYVYNISGDVIDASKQIGRPVRADTGDSSNIWLLVDARSPGAPNPHFNFANSLWLDGHVEQTKAD